MDESAPGNVAVDRSSPFSIWLPRVGILILLALMTAWAGWMGVRFRHWVWDTTEPIRFLSDTNRGYAWGRKSATEGFLNQYEKMRFEQPGDKNWLDYAPLRLGVMTLWGRWSLEHFSHVKVWQNDHSYALTAPVLHFNLFMELVGVTSAFFLYSALGDSGMRCTNEPFIAALVFPRLCAGFYGGAVIVVQPCHRFKRLWVADMGSLDRSVVSIGGVAREPELVVRSGDCHRCGRDVQGAATYIRAGVCGLVADPGPAVGVVAVVQRSGTGDRVDRLTVAIELHTGGCTGPRPSGAAGTW